MPPFEKPKELLVFIVRRDTKCAECGEELAHGSFITLEEKGALCLSCADLDHLEFLPSGDPAITRRAAKHSRLHAKVLEWSRSRKRYERQGILVEPKALQQAEEECLADGDIRQRRREREAERREVLDQQFIEEFARQILQVFPSCPAETAEKIAQHACLKYSGRVGRSASAKNFDYDAIVLAVRAHVRHCHTQYDDLLFRGYERFEARELVKHEVEELLAAWKRSNR